MPSIEEIKEAMYEMVCQSTGKRKLRPRELIVAVSKKYAGQVTKDQCKEALRQLIDEGRCIYTYYMGNYVELPCDESR